MYFNFPLYLHEEEDNHRDRLLRPILTSQVFKKKAGQTSVNHDPILKKGIVTFQGFL